jgi:8-oxo-dGTP pyrophosphatase MutT (NUDIX family)
VEIPVMKTRIFTSGLLVYEGRVLLLKRRPDDERNPNRWDCLGGHFLAEESGEDCMIREAKEESGLDVRIRKSGRVFEFRDSYGRAVGLPYLLGSDSNRVRPTEHSRYVWVPPKAASRYDCVPEVAILLRRFRLA